jgi:antitoxin HigA-1
MLPKNRLPTPPGEVLDEEFLSPMGLTQTALAERMGVAVQQVNLIVAGRRSITPPTAIKLAKALDIRASFAPERLSKRRAIGAERDVSSRVT